VGLSSHHIYILSHLFHLFLKKTYKTQTIFTMNSHILKTF
jgi:hypothetical protein